MPVPLILCFVILALLAVVFACLALLDPQTLKNAIDHLSMTGSADFLTPAKQRQLQTVFSVLAVIVSAGFVWGLKNRPRLVAGFECLKTGFHDDRNRFVEGLHTFTSPKHRIELIGLSLLTILGAWLRITHLGIPMRYDESFSYLSYSSTPLANLVTNYLHQNNHILHNILVHGTTAMLGGDPWVIRLPACAAGILMIPASFLALRFLTSPIVALTTCFLVATSSILIEQSVNGRGYTMVGFLFLLAIPIAQRLRSRSRVSTWIVFILILALGLYTIPVMLFPLSGLMIWILLGRPRIRDVTIATVATAVVSLTFYGPVILKSGLSVFSRNQILERGSMSQWFQHFCSSTGHVVDLWAFGLDPITPWALTLGLVALAILRPPRHRLLLSLSLSTVLAFITLTAVLARTPPLRVWHYLFVPIAGCGVAGIVTLLRPVIPRSTPVVSTVAALGIASLILVAGDRRLPDRPDRFHGAYKAMSALKDRLRPNDQIFVALPADAALRYHAKSMGVSLDCFVETIETGSTVYVVVDPRHQSPESVLELMASDISGSTVQVVKQPTFAIFMVSRSPPDAVR